MLLILGEKSNEAELKFISVLRRLSAAFSGKWLFTVRFSRAVSLRGRTQQPGLLQTAASPSCSWKYTLAHVNSVSQFVQSLDFFNFLFPTMRLMSCFFQSVFNDKCFIFSCCSQFREVYLFVFLFSFLGRFTKTAHNSCHKIDLC